MESAYGRFEWPDPRLWPRDEVQRYREATEPRSLCDVFILNITRDTSACYLEDAITCLSVIDVPRDQWHTDRGYPCFTFSRSKLQHYISKLQAAKYTVRLLNNPANERPNDPRVVNIATARESMNRKRRRWA